jgi:hypothetical protein
MSGQPVPCSATFTIVLRSSARPYTPVRVGAGGGQGRAVFSVVCQVAVAAVAAHAAAEAGAHGAAGEGTSLLACVAAATTVGAGHTACVRTGQRLVDGRAAGA